MKELKVLETTNVAKPFDEWTKEEIVAIVSKSKQIAPIVKPSEFDGIRLEILKDFCLLLESDNNGIKTYKVGEDFSSLIVKDLWEEESMYRYYEEARKYPRSKPVKVRFMYADWVGKPKHLKAVLKKGYGIRKGDRIYYLDGNQVRYKKETGKYVEILDKYDRAPRGTAKEFAKIAKGVK